MWRLIAALVAVACVVHGASIDQRAMFDSLAPQQQPQGANVEAYQVEKKHYDRRAEEEKKPQDWSWDRRAQEEKKPQDWSWDRRAQEEKKPQDWSWDRRAQEEKNPQDWSWDRRAQEEKKPQDWSWDRRAQEEKKPQDWSWDRRGAEDVLPQNIDDPLLQENDIQDVEGRDFGDHNDFSYDLDNSDVRGAPACSRCGSWYNTERRTNMAWLAQVNREIPCPCTASASSYGFTAVDKASEDWDTDPVCTRYGRPYCRWYHPGADGCLQSVTTTSTGARQQCCYSSQGRLLAPTHRGAGTPDKASDRYDHQMTDLQPYKWCCMGCTNQKYCNYYLQLRKGSDAHCRAGKKP